VGRRVGQLRSRPEERTVLIEFESVAAAMACHDSPAYQAALKAFDGGAERDLRIIEALK
jgi:uncharacterized protein (DUF1330 family)